MGFSLVPFIIIFKCVPREIKSKGLITKYLLDVFIYLSVYIRVCTEREDKRKTTAMLPCFPPTRLKMLVAAKDSREATHYDCLWSFLLWAATSVEKITTFPLMNQDLLLTRYYCLFHSDRKYSPLTGTANIGSHQMKWRFFFSLLHLFLLSSSLLVSPTSLPAFHSHPFPSFSNFLFLITNHPNLLHRPAEWGLSGDEVKID